MTKTTREKFILETSTDEQIDMVQVNIKDTGQREVTSGVEIFWDEERVYSQRDE